MAYVIGDFSFDTEEEAKEAQREVQAISYIMKQINTEDPQAVLAAYQQMVKKNLFHTKLGIGFLEDMRKQLLALPEISDADVPEIPQIAAKQENEKRILIKEDESKHAEEDKKIKKKTESKIQSSAKTQDKAETKQKIDAKQEQAKEKKSRQISQKHAKIKEEQPMTVEEVTVAIKKYKKMSHILLIACVTMLLIIIGMFAINATSQNPTILNYEEKIINKYASWEQQLDQREQELNEREQQLKQ